MTQTVSDRGPQQYPCRAGGEQREGSKRDRALGNATAWRRNLAGFRGVGPDRGRPIVLNHDPHPNPLPQAGEGVEALTPNLSRKREREREEP